MTDYILFPRLVLSLPQTFPRVSRAVSFASHFKAIRSAALSRQ
jgi:hypothetical protein